VLARPPNTGDRRDVNDGSSARLSQCWDLVTQSIQYPAQTRVDDTLPILDVDIADAHTRNRRRHVIESVVKSAVGVDSVFDGSLKLGGIGDVRVHCTGLASIVDDGFRDRFG